MGFSIGIKSGQSKSEYLISLIHHCNKRIYFHSAPKLQQDEVVRLLKNGAMTQKEIQERLGIQPASVSELITKLENRGFVKRKRSKEDKRIVCIELTESGLIEAEHVSTHIHKQIAQINLPDEDFDQLITLLESLHESLTNDSDKEKQ